MKIIEARKTGRERLEQAGISEADLDARLLLEWAAGIELMDYIMNPEKELVPEEEERYLEALRKRESRVPLQHITGVQEFMGFPFHVNEHVLVPRQDTEILVEEALKVFEPGMNVLDMCTGSGCIAISLCLFEHGKGQFTGADLSVDALYIARENAKDLNAQVEFIETDLFSEVLGKYHMIVSNPPYIATAEIQKLEDEVKIFDPWMALDGKEDGLYFYRKIIEEAPMHLEDGGWLLFEIGHDQKEAVMELMRQNGYHQIMGKKDLAGLDRVVVGRYTKV